MAYKSADGFPYYRSLVKDEEVHSLFASTATFPFLASIGEEQAKQRYAPDKWSIKQVVGHITDHERIKMFRAFQLSRQMPVELWGYDQEHLVTYARFDDLKLEQLIQDLTNVRQASLSFIKTLSTNQFNLIGQARQYQITLEDFLKSIIGHERHHLQIIREKYMR